MKDKIEISKIRQAIADYIATEGCACCQDIDGHEKAMKKIGKLLKMEKFANSDEFNYRKYVSEKFKKEL